MRSGIHEAYQAMQEVMDRAHEMLCSRKGAKSAKIMIPQIMSASGQDKHGGSCDAQR